MSKTLVIAEKTEAAKALMEGLPYNFSTHKYDNKINKSKIPNFYYESNEVIVVAARGHLFRLLNIEEYLDLPKKTPWTLDNLPFIPKNFKLVPNDNENDKGFCKAQFQLIKELIERADVSLIVNFGDPDNEGELLIREILGEANNIKPVKRLICKSLTSDSLSKAFYDLKNQNDYNFMYFEALARQQSDWIMGINFSRFISLKTKNPFFVGRVLVPIVKYIYDRDYAIEHFKSEKSWGINAEFIKDGNKFSVNVSKPEIKFEPDKKVDCEDLCSKLNSSETIVDDVIIANKKMQPKKLFNTANYYSEMSTKCGVTMDDAANAAEKLYLSKFITYPRTDLEYLLTSEASTMESIISKYAAEGFPVRFDSKSSVFDDKKCGGAGEGGHTAITITENMPSDDEIEGMTDAERAAYFLILNRTLSNFCEKPIYEETKVILKNREYLFTLTGNRLISQGFLVFEPRKLKTELPEFKKSDIIDANYIVAERETVPPSKVTPKQLLSYLANPFADELKKKGKKDDEEYYKIIKEGATIGTPATMKEIVAKAVRYKYISQGKKNYSITEKGKALIKILDELQINLYADKTIEMNKAIKKVGNKIITLQENKAELEAELNSVIDANRTTVINVSFKGDNSKKSIGKCPRCGKDVIESKYGWCCSGYPDCKFGIYSDDKYFERYGKKVTETMAKSFLENGFAIVKGCKSSTKKDANGKPKIFDCKFIVDYSNKYPRYTLEFINKKKEKK